MIPGSQCDRIAATAHNIRKRIATPIGERRGYTTVIAEGPLQVIGLIRKVRTVQCRCDCGILHFQPLQTWKRRPTLSCGCHRYDFPVTKNRTHGGAEHPLYCVWSSMRQRCTNPNNKRWDRYGGRGIKVCDRWQDFANFLADMGERPPGMSLDRYPNQDGDYEPGNCRWATAFDQQRNKSTNIFITALGVTRTLVEWSEVSGINYCTLKDRLNNGWALDDAVTLPADNSRRYKAKHMGGRIHELRRHGLRIKTEMIEVSGEKRIARYSLAQKKGPGVVSRAF